MGSRPSSSLGARVYALLLHLYPTSFRREYGESMLQLFNDQRRAASGAGGTAMLWLKTLRDLALSVPAAHANGPEPSSAGARFLWTVVVILGLVFLLNAVILPSWISRIPSEAGSAVVAAPVAGPTGEYRAIAQVAAGVASTLFAVGVFLFAARRRSMATGIAAFVAGVTLTFMALAINPWLWVPLDRYPVAIAWALGIWPLLAAAWVALRIVGRRNQRLGGV
jgi:hypothetical protein